MTTSDGPNALRGVKSQTFPCAISTTAYFTLLGTAAQPTESGKRADHRGERVVSIRLAQLLDVVAAGGHANHLDAGAVAGDDVARGVADGDAGAVGEGAAGDQRTAGERHLVTSVRSAESEP